MMGQLLMRLMLRWERLGLPLLPLPLLPLLLLLLLLRSSVFEIASPLLRPMKLLALRGRT